MRRPPRIFTLVSVLGSAFAALALIFSSSAAATQSSGYIEICKTFAAGPAGSPAYSGTFKFVVNGNTANPVSITANQGGQQVCTAPISVPAGTATVQELAQPWFSVASITATPGDPGSVTASTTTAGLATLSVASGSQSQTTTVQYLDDPVTGIVEVCKQAAAGSSALTGTYNFTITSEDSGISWSGSASATISALGLGCSGPVTVPAGTIQTVEPGITSVTAITATSNGANALVGAANLALGTAQASVSAGDTTDQTIVTYTDALSTVKLCKQWTGSPAPSTSFPFAVTSSGVAGPTAVTSPPSGLTAGNCYIVGYVRPGTQVNITESVVPGTKVASIGVTPSLNTQGVSPIVPNTLSLPNRTISVIAGAGETDVTFTDETADPGTLKICVMPAAGDTPAAGTVPFTVNGSQMVDVNLSSTAEQCTLDNLPNSAFAFDSSVTIAGGALPAGDAFSGLPTPSPVNVEVLEGGVLTPTNQATVTASTASTATVLMSEGIVTEVTFSVDPPAPVTAPTVTSSQTGSGLTVVSTGTSAGGASTPAVTAAMAKLKRERASCKAQIKRLRKKLSRKHLRPSARKAAAKKLAADRSLLRKLNRKLS